MKEIKPSALSLLMFRYQSPVVPLEKVIGDFFTHLSLAEANRRATKQALPFAVFKAEDSRKAPFLVNIECLAAYLDSQAKIGQQDFENINRNTPAHS